MKTLLTFLFILFPITGCFSQSQPAKDPNTWDFGMIKKNQVVTHDFLIVNNSEKVLNIKDVSTSCGCTASAVGKKILRPGESTQVKVDFNSKGYKGETSQFVYVSTDDPVNPIMKYTIRAFVQ